MKQLRLSLTLLASLGLSSLAWATDFDFSGTFSKDNDVIALSFTVGAPSTVTVFSSSWVSGGLDPILAIWDSSGNLINEQDDGHVIGTTLSNSVAYSTGNWDSYYTVSLGAGTYTATIAEYNNFAVGSLLSQGFIHDGPAGDHFTNIWGSQADFNGVGPVGSDPRTGDWAFHLLNVDEANQVPDTASTFGLLAAGLALMAGMRRRFSQSL